MIFRIYKVYLVNSGSMSPSVPVGSLVFVKKEKPTDYKVGDVVTFITPDAHRSIVTHRISNLFTNAFGLLMMQTKGDANTNGDPWETDIGSVIGKVKFQINWIGYYFVLTKTRSGFLVFVLCSFVWWVLPEFKKY